MVSEQTAKRQKTGIVADVATTASPRSSDFCTVVASPQAEMVTEKNKFVENVVHQSCKPNAVVAMHEPASLKQSIRPLAPAGAPYGMKRFKLDNRPTAFKIIPPLPTGLANVSLTSSLPPLHLCVYFSLISYRIWYCMHFLPFL